MELFAGIVITLLLLTWLVLSETEIGDAIAEWIRRRP